MQSFTVERFGGLDVVTDPFEIGAAGATAMTNMDLDLRGALTVRDGTTDFATFDQATPASNPYSILFDAAVGNLIGTAGSNTYALSNTGSQVTSSAFSIATDYSVANYATPSAPLTFMAPLSGGVLRQFNGTAFSTPTYTGTQPTGFYVASTPVSGRLVNFGLGSGSPRVIFSDVGNPLSFPANNFVDINLGGGDYAFAAKTVDDNLILISQSKIIVFWGESVDSSGNPVFNYRVVNAPWRDAGMGPIVEAPDGVYVMTSTGLWRTNGNGATLVSDALSPLVKGLLTPALQLTTSGAYADGRLYFSASSGSIATPDWVLVYDLKMQTWLMWAVTHRTIASGRSQRVPRVYVGRRTGTTPNRVAYFNPAATTDGGTAIDFSYTSGKYRLADANQSAVSDYSSLTGSGTVSLRIDSDQYSNQNGTATLGTAPAVAEGWPTNVDQEGTWFQFTLSGTGPATVSRLLHNVQSVKPAGIR